MSIQFIKNKTINKVVLINVESIVPNPFQPRSIFDKNEIEELSNSITLNGLLQPLTVRKQTSFYELISGERRLRALKFAGITHAPCIVVDVDDAKSSVLALIENIQRTDLNFFEEARAMKLLMNTCSISQIELANKLGKSQPSVANKLRLLKFNNDIQNDIIKNGLNERQARALLKVQNEEKIKFVINYIQNNKLNVAQTEAYIEQLNSGKEQNQIKRFHPIVKDIRVFLNTINNAIDIMNSSGINAHTQRKDSNGYIEYIIKIPIKPKI